MTHSDLVLRAVRWLRAKGCSVVYSEMTTSAFETPDAIGWKGEWSRVVECKVSRSDFFSDRKKAHCLTENSGMGTERWYLTPPGLVTAEEVPAWCGLLYAHPKKIEIVKKAPHRQDIWPMYVREEIKMLLSAIRRSELGSQFDHERARWEPMMSRLARQKKA